VTRIEMKRKVMAIGIIFTFVLTTFFGASALGMKLESTDDGPDYIVDSIWVLAYGEYLEPGEEVHISVHIYNQGGDADKDSTTAIYFDDKIYKVPMEGALPGGIYTGASIYVNWPDDYKEHPITAKVDFNNDLTESNENNNDKTESFKASKARSRTLPIPETVLINGNPDLKINHWIICPKTWRPGGNFKLTVYVENTGDEDAPRSVTAIKIDDKIYTEHNTDPIKAGEEYSFTHTITWPNDYEYHWLKTICDYSGKITEENENNNDMSIPYKASNARNRNLIILEDFFARFPLLQQLLKLK